MLIVVSFQEDVVDQAGRADPGGDGEGRAVEVGDRDVLGLDAGVGEDRAGPLRVAGRERPRDRQGAARRSSGESRRFRDESARPSGSRTVVDDADLELEVEVADELLHDRDLLGVLASEVGDVGTRRS